MLRWGVVALALLLGVMLPGGAAAEQASQPSAVAAGGLAVGAFHACAVLPGGSVRCWGYGRDGALGYASRDSIGDDETPAAAGPVDLGAGRTATAVETGAVHSCALLGGGAVRCWGFGGDGRLGHANTATVGDDEAPSSAGPVDLGDGRTAEAISVGGAHTCAVLDDGTVRCWGYAYDGRLGYADTVVNSNSANNVGDDETPGSKGAVKLGDGRTAKAITTGRAHTCAVLDDGNVRCWGLASNGQLGYGATEIIGDYETPDAAGPVKLGLGRTAVAITAGNVHTCALLDDGKVRCWGFGGNGRLGHRSTSSIGDKLTPDTVDPIDLGPGRAVAISAGGDHTCALLDDGSVRCWGVGRDGRLGYANTRNVGDDETPSSVGPVDLGAGRTAVAISAGGASTCARLDDGDVRCWGVGADGRLGTCELSSIGDDETPGSLGPIDLGVPGRAGVSCRTAPPPPPPLPAAPGDPGPSTPLPAVGGSPAVPAPGPAVPTAGGGGAAPPPDSAAAALAAQARRATALRGCLTAATRSRDAERRRAAQRPAAKRRTVLRQIARRAERRRRGCLGRHGRTPGRVTGLAARATGRRTIRLSFRAAGTDAAKAPAARSYLIKQSRRPILTARDFRRATSLCKGSCSFAVTDVAAPITLKVTDLRPRSAYHYAVMARDNVTARTGRRSGSVRARTP